MCSIGGYDPLTHGGYGTVDDYAPYPHLTSQTPDYGSNAPSRQDYAAPNKAHQGHLRSIGEQAIFSNHCQVFMTKFHIFIYLFSFI